MCCKSCKSENRRKVGAEVAVHFPGLKGLDMPIVKVLAELKVCLECGLAEFEIPERELQILKEGDIDGV